MTTRDRTRTVPTTGPRALTRGLVAAGGAAVLALGLGACGDTAGDETATSVEDVNEAESEVETETEVGAETGELGYEGAYDSAFVEEQESLIGQEVTVSAAVNTVLDDSSFTIAGDGSDVEPLLVVSATSGTTVEEDMEVDVSGTVEQAFVLTEVEEELGLDLEDELYTEWEGQTYIMANAIDVGAEDEG
ncbi:hypothetical protein [Kineococcus sp. G2]|uniref:hypothetical protein n=1 Tax=Kineococcus sp. G2 TaxID=3127484 RepID=UPI00301C70E4